MTHCKTKQIKLAHQQYKKSNSWELFHCYDNYSYNKEKAMDYCKELMSKYDGFGLYIIGHNSMTFSVGFYGKIDGKKAFFYITKNYDRYIYTDELDEVTR